MILVTGSTGFVGSHLVEGLAKAGHPVRALVRKGSRLEKIKLPGVEPAFGDVSDPVSLERAAAGCEAVIHLVGIIQPGPGYTFESIHVLGTRNVLEAATKAGTVRHFIYQSAQGTRRDAPSEYHKTKYKAEELTKASGLNYTITRPSIIFGKGDGFTARLTDIIRGAPMAPVIGAGRSRLQPIYIDNLVDVFLRVLLDTGFFGRTIGLCGPEQLEFNEIIEELKDALGVRKPTLHVPMGLVRPVAALMEKVLKRPPVTTDQLTMLQEDNICEADVLGELGITPVSFKEGLKRFIG